jgi:hypothetical protein
MMGAGKGGFTTMRHRSYITYRVLVRLDQQAETALRYGRENDARSIWMLIGKLEYQHFEALSFEHAFDKAVAQ